MVTEMRSAQSTLRSIETWEHWSEIGLVAAKEYGVSQEQYAALLPEYQRFLALICSGYRGLGMFSKDIDEIWHSHILHTSLYADFCERFNGVLIQHFPQLTPKARNQCTTCKSCKDCSIRCKQPHHEGFDASSAEYFRSAYITEFDETPGDVWRLPIADGVAV
jgi:hypothetical protein